MGDEIKLTGLTVEILQVLDDGRPAKSPFTSGSHSDASLRWLYWKGGEFLPYKPPAIGQRETLEVRHWLAGTQ